jgi:hypothetical protein
VALNNRCVSIILQNLAHLFVSWRMRRTAKALSIMLTAVAAFHGHPGCSPHRSRRDDFCFSDAK